MLTVNNLGRHTVAIDSSPKPIRVSSKWAAHAITFLMVFGPGLIVMEADNDAGAVSTYVQAGAQFGTHLLWLLLLLLPICYFIQEMVVRLGIAEVLGHFANRRWNNIVNWCIVILLFVLSLLLAAQVAAPQLFPNA